MATIKDVAKLANVSVSTVSLALNGKKNISEEKYNRIIEAIEQLQYRPNYIAQNLKKQKAHIIGLVLPDIEGHYGQIFRGIDNVLEGDEHFVITKISENNIQKENLIFEQLLDIGVSGILAVPCEPENVEKYENFVKKGVPIVFIERKVNSHSFSNVVFDNKTIVYRRTRELLARFRPEEMMLITGPAKYSSESDCIEGYAEAIASYSKEKELPKQSVRTFEVWLQKEYAFNTLFDYFCRLDDMPKCCVVSDGQVARVLGEVFSILKADVDISSLTGGDWMCVTRDRDGIVKQTREAVKLGEKSATLLTKFIRNARLVENQNIVVYSRDDTEDDVHAVSVKNSRKTLRLLLFASNAMDALIKLSRGFERHYDIKLDYNVLPYLDLKNELRAQIAAGSSDYDIVMVDLPWVNSVQKSGFLLNLKSMTEDDGAILGHYPQGIKTAFFKNQHSIYGLPVIASIQTMYYRGDIFEDKDIHWSFYKKYGFELCPPRTWTEFNYIAEFFNRSANPNSPVKYGTTICGLKPTGIVEEFLPRQWAFNGRIVDEWGKICIDSDENIRALENLYNTYKHSPEESLGWFFDDAFNQLLSGEIVMAAGFATHYLPYKYSKLDDTYDRFIKVTTIPGGKPMLGSWILGINRHSNAPEESFAFLRWATSNQLAVHNTLMGGAVPLKAVCDNTLLKTKFPWLRYIDESFSNMGTREVVRDRNGNIIDPDLVETALADAIYKVLLGEATVQQALSQAKEALTSLTDN